MRRIVTTLMAACLLFFVACSDEGDDVTIYNGDTFTSDYKANQMYSTLCPSTGNDKRADTSYGKIGSV